MALKDDNANYNRETISWNFEVCAITLVSLAFGFCFSYPMLGHFGQMTLSLDWSWALDWSWTVWHTISHYHQFPFWSPYKCGGMPSLANPQSHFLSPFLLLRLLVGPIAGLELEVPLHITVAFAGGYVLARSVGCTPIAALAGALTFAGSSWLPLHAAAGHDVLLPGAYMPWVCAFTWTGIKQRRIGLAAVAGLFLALCFYEGGVYEVLQLAIFLAVIGGAAAVVEHSPRPILIVCTVAIFAIGFAAFKLFPSMAMMRAHPRNGYLSEESLYKTLLSVFSRKQDFVGPWGEGGFWEHGAYVGAAFALLALVGIIKSPRRALPWITAAAVFFMLAMGGTSPHSLYVLLHRLPGFASTYAPFRFLIAFVLAVAVLAALGTDYLLQRGQWAVIGLLLIGFIDALLVSPTSLSEPFASKTFAIPPSSMEFRQYYDSSPTNIGMLPLNLANRGAVNCYEANYFDVSSTHVIGYNQPGYKGEQFLEGAGSVRLLKWSPEELEYEVHTSSPAVLVINQNYYEGWRLAAGDGVVRSENGLLAVAVPGKSQDLRVIYRAPWAILGAWIFVITSACTAILLWKESS